MCIPPQTGLPGHTVCDNGPALSIVLGLTLEYGMLPLNFPCWRNEGVIAASSLLGALQLLLGRSLIPHNCSSLGSHIRNPWAGLSLAQHFQPLHPQL